MLITTFGSSVVTFDGVQGGAVEPRTSCHRFHFDQEDSRMVEELRAWAAGRLAALPSPLVPLSAVQPSTFFDLTCQLLAKACMDSTCTLLRVRSLLPVPSSSRAHQERGAARTFCCLE